MVVPRVSTKDVIQYTIGWIGSNAMICGTSEFAVFTWQFIGCASIVVT